jgi:hypothetical protein
LSPAAVGRPGGRRAAALALAAPAAYATPPKQMTVKDARFKVTVKGTQTTTWSADQPAQSRCLGAHTGSGTEKVTFKSKRRVVARAFALGKGPITWIVGSDQAELPMKGSVTRRGSETFAPTPPDCAVGDGDGTSAPPASDCGTKKIRSLKLLLAYDVLSRNRITLSNGGQAEPRFEQCPRMGEGWTTILSRDDRKRTAGEELPRSDVFDRRQGKMIVLGHGKVTSNDKGVRSTTRIEWELTLVRRR